MSGGSGWVDRGHSGGVEAVPADPEHPLESELAWAEANIAAGLGGQAMQDRKRRVQEALAQQGGNEDAVS